MSIPGIGQAALPVSNLFLKNSVHANFRQAVFAPTRPATPVIHDIRANSEWRFEVAFGQSIEVKASRINLSVTLSMLNCP